MEQIGALPFAHIRELVAGMVTVTEDEMLAAVRLLAIQARLVAEPGGAAAVAAWLYHRDELPGVATPVAVVSGGNIDPTLAGDDARRGLTEGRGDTTASPPAAKRYSPTWGK